MEWPDNRYEYLPHIKAIMAKGRGCGSGATFKPWTNLRTRTRKGTERAFKCSKTGRQVEFKSCAHEAYFLLHERRPSVTSIEEEFPLLNMAQTMPICRKMGLTQPAKKGLPDPLVACFLIREVRDGRTIVFMRSLTSGSFQAGETRSQLDAIAEGCAQLGVEWKAVDASPLNPTMLASLQFSRAWIPQRFKPDPDQAKQFADAFLKVHRRPSTLKELLEAITAKLGIPMARAILQFRHASWAGYIHVDFRHVLALNETVHLLHRD